MQYDFGMPRLLAAVALLSMLACAAAPQRVPSMPSTTRTGEPLRQTAELVADAGLARLVDELASAPAIEGPAIGGGSPSRIYALAERIANAADYPQLLRLRQHVSPIVRGYVIWTVFRKWPAQIADLTPLFSDEAVVTVYNGCRRFSAPLSELLMDELEEQATSKAAEGMLLAAARGAWSLSLQSRALPLLRASQPRQAVEIAIALLSQPDPGLLQTALGVLGQVDPGQHAELIAPLTESEHEWVRAAAAVALKHAPGRTAERALVQLMDDPQSMVRARALASYVFHPSCSPDLRQRLLGDPDLDVRSAATIALALQGDESGLALAFAHIEHADERLLEPAAGARTRPTEKLFLEMAEVPGLAPLMRRLLPGSTHPFVRDRAFLYLAKHADRASLPHFRAALAVLHPERRIAAMHAIAALGDRASIASLVRGLPRLSGEDLAAAARALVTLGARSAAPAIVRAAARSEPALRQQLTSLAASLAAPSKR